MDAQRIRSGGSGGPDPRSVRTYPDLLAAVDALRRYAARGTGRARISLNELAARAGIPRSTLHVYLGGERQPTPDAYDAILLALGVPAGELRPWADAYERVSDQSQRSRPIVDNQRSTPIPAQLVMAPPELIGRRAELEYLDTALARNGGVLTVSGPGGIGKSSLVTTWAHQRSKLFPDGQIWLDLHGFGTQPPITAADALGRMLRALGEDGERLPGDVDSRAEMFRGLVAGRRLLIVLDNAANSEHVRHLLPGTSTCAVIVTSRVELRQLAIEFGASRLRLTPLTEDDSLRMLSSVVDNPSSRRLAAQCAGLPLALRIVVERLAGRPAGEAEWLADELEDHTRRLSVLAVSEGETEIGISSVLDASYRRLTAEQTRMLRLAPLGQGRGITIEAAATLINATPQEAISLLEVLVGASLLDKPGPDLYLANDLVAEYAARRREEQPEDSADADARLLEHLGRRAASACSILVDYSRPPGEAPPARLFADAESSWSWAEANTELIVSTADRALRQPDPPASVWSLLSDTFWCRLLRADQAPLGPVLAVGVEAARRVERLEAEALMWRAIGIAAGSTGAFDEAKEAFTHQLQLSRLEGTDWLEERALGNLATAANLGGDNAAAMQVLDERLKLLTRIGVTPLETLMLMSTCHFEAGDLDEAWRLIERADRHRSDPDADPVTIALVAFDRALILLARGGSVDEARSIVRRGQTAARIFPDVNLELTAARAEAEILRLTGQTTEALRVLDAVESLLPRAINPADASAVILTRARVIADMSSPAAAIPVLRQAVAVARRGRMPYKIASALTDLSCALAADGNSECRDVAREALDLCDRRNFGRLEQRAAEILRRPVEMIDR